MRSLILLAAAVMGAGVLPALALESTDRMVVSSPRLSNSVGEDVTGHININQQVHVAAKITNGQDVKQPFLYILQIKNSDRHIVAIEIISLDLEPAQSLDVATSWSPTEAGAYVAEIFIWESLANADALSRPVTLEMTAG